MPGAKSRKASSVDDPLHYRLSSDCRMVGRGAQATDELSDKLTVLLGTPSLLAPCEGVRGELVPFAPSESSDRQEKSREMESLRVSNQARIRGSREARRASARRSAAAEASTSTALRK